MIDGLGDAVVIASAPADVGAIITQLRAVGARQQHCLLVIEPGIAALDRAMLVAAIGVLAAELAPDSRIGAIDIAAGARDEDVIAAAGYLRGAVSTTGQVIRVAP